MNIETISAMTPGSAATPSADATSLIKSTVPTLNLTPDIHYVAMTPSKDGEIVVGTPVYIQKDKHIFAGREEGDWYFLFGVFRNGGNDVRNFDSLEALAQVLEGVEVVLDKRHAREQIDKMQRDIRRLEHNYKL